MNAREVILSVGDRLTCGLIGLLVLGSTLGFGGEVWWFKPVLAIGACLLVFVRLAQSLAMRQMNMIKSPLIFLGLLTLALAVFQLIPLPAPLANRVSPTAHDVYSHGFLSALVHKDDPETELPPPLAIRSPATVDRSATLHWLVSAAACLSIFWAVADFTDRLQRLYFVWGLMIAGFLFNTAMGIVQITTRSDGLYGALVPGSGPYWAPSLDDALVAPTLTLLKNLPEATPIGTERLGISPRAVLVPSLPFLFGSLMGGSGAFLALGAVSLPLALAIVLHLISPRGSRESLTNRLGRSSLGSLITLILILMFPGAVLIGLAAGPVYCLPYVLGLAIVLVPTIMRSQSRGIGSGLMLLLFSGLGLGVALQTWWSSISNSELPLHPPDLIVARGLWSAGLDIIRQFPWVGVGLGCFNTIYPYFKTMTLSSTTAMSTLLQWAVEAGSLGLAILLIAVLWSLIKLPGGLRRINRSERSLAYGLIGAVVSIGVLAVIHWTVELSTIAISASALGGIWNRWLAGGTDLFVEGE